MVLVVAVLLVVRVGVARGGGGGVVHVGHARVGGARGKGACNGGAQWLGWVGVMFNDLLRCFV